MLGPEGVRSQTGDHSVADTCLWLTFPHSLWMTVPTELARNHNHVIIHKLYPAIFWAFVPLECPSSRLSTVCA